MTQLLRSMWTVFLVIIIAIAMVNLKQVRILTKGGRNTSTQIYSYFDCKNSGTGSSNFTTSRLPTVSYSFRCGYCVLYAAITSPKIAFFQSRPRSAATPRTVSSFSLSISIYGLSQGQTSRTISVLPSFHVSLLDSWNDECGKPAAASSSTVL